MAFVHCKTLRSERLNLGGRQFDVDLAGIVEVPDDMAAGLVGAIPGEYAFTDQAPTLSMGPTNADLREGVAALEELLERQREDMRRIVEDGDLRVRQIQFHLDNREQRLADAGERIAELELAVEELEPLRSRLAVAEEQVQLLLRQNSELLRSGPAEKTNEAPADGGRKGKRG